MFGADTKIFTSVVTVPAVVLAGGKLTISGETIVTVLACMIISDRSDTVHQQDKKQVRQCWQFRRIEVLHS